MEGKRKRTRLVLHKWKVNSLVDSFPSTSPSTKILDLCTGLEDFEALTPNLLARTIETLEGGGLIVLLIRSLSSLTRLYTMDAEGFSEAERELKEQLNDDFPVGPLIRKYCTLDQGNAVITFLDAILDKKLCSTVALLAACGRGKSAALGLAIAEAIAAGYSNIETTRGCKRMEGK